MKTTIFAYSKQGCRTAEKIASFFDGRQVRMFTPERLKQEGFNSIPRPAGDFYGEQFSWSDTMIFVSSCGIAVRETAPYVRDKRTDPAVLCIDERATFAIPLLSGHIGGANELAVRLATYLNATPVITTATDINGRFSVDTWATRNRFIIDNMNAVKKVSCAILEQDIPLYCEFPIITPLPNGVIHANAGSIGIYVGIKTGEPFEDTLHIIPPILHLGIGCRKGTDAKTIEKLVERVLNENGIDKRAIKMAASIDLKEEEQGLLEYCNENSWRVDFYTAQELLTVRGDFIGSKFVQEVTGVDNVCERAAMMDAERLIIGKTAADGVTVAIAAEKMEVSFE